MSSTPPTLPSLFTAADEAAILAQADVAWWFKLKTAVLVVAATIALIPEAGVFWAIMSTLLFLASLAIHIYSERLASQRQWYSARALAESIKTSSWRLLMGAEPFARGGVDERVDEFVKVVRQLIQQNQDIVRVLSASQLGLVQVTNEFRDAMAAPYAEKAQWYLTGRIEDQRKWYVARTASSRAASRRIFWMICAAYTVAVLMLLVRIALPEWRFLPVNAVAVVASGLIGWKELRRYDELASAYALTAVELGFIQERFARVNDASALSEFVTDAENVFSREHTQWAARRDHLRIGV